MTLRSPTHGYALERIAGDSGTMSWWAGRLTRVKDQLDDLHTSAAAVQSLPGVGQSVTAARSRAGDLLAAISPDADEATLLAQVMQDYADAHDRYAKPANDLIEQIETAHATWVQASAEAAEARRWAGAAEAALNSLMGDIVFDDLILGLADEAEALSTTAQQNLSTLWGEYERHRSGWETAYDDALAALACGSGAVLSSDQRELLERMLAADTPGEVQRLWREHPELHDELLDAHPELLGNLDGIPYDDRARANRAHLDALLATEPPGGHRDDLEAIKRALNAEGNPRPSLISFDPTGAEQVTAAIAYGDLSTASEINSLVPGMNSNVRDLAEWGEAAKALNRSVGPGSATVTWFGYDSPNLAEEPGMGRAEDGAAALSSYLEGLRTLAPNAEINVVAHSYGSTTAALAIGSQPDGHGVTSFIAVGSAGFPDDETVRANLTNGQPPQVYATLSEDDAVARIGRGTAPNHSVSPETMSGVTVFDSDGGIDHDGGELPAATGHGAFGPGAYLEPGSESFYNVSEIIRTGQPGTERQGEGSTEGFWDQNNWWISDEYSFIDF